MGILNNKLKKITTKNFYFGAPEAEGENKQGHSLVDYFEDYLDILDHLDQGKFIFTGRKGVGKSAIAKFIKDKSDDSKDSFAVILRISDFEIHKLIQNFDTDKEELLFEWLILVNIVKLLVKAETSKYTIEFNKLRKFLENNSGMVSVDKYQMNETNKSTNGEISFGVLSHVFGGVMNKYFSVKETRAPFYKLIPPLKEIIQIVLDYPVSKDLEFWLLFDDLDIDFDLNNEKDNKKIINLIRLAKSYNNEIFKTNKAKILIFIRDDIKKNIITKYPDSAKIFASYEINISWYNDSNIINESDNSLKKLANKRIEINFNNYNINTGGDPWGSLISNDISYSHYKSSFKYILDFTFYRPRDIITLLTTISKNNYQIPIQNRDLRQIIDNYISTNVKEIKSELSLHFNEDEKNIIFRDVFPLIISEKYLTYDKLLNKIEKFSFLLDSSNVIDLLLEYSLIVYQNGNGDLFFNYRENNEIDKSNNRMYLTLPKCIYHFYKRLVF